MSNYSVTISGVDIVKRGIKLLNVTIESDWSKVAKHVPVTISRVWQNIFRESGSRFGHAWKTPSVWTKLLRAKGARKKYKSLQEARDTYIAPLQDTGGLRKSFMPSDSHSTYGFGPKMVFGGSKLQKARTLNDGGKTDPFKFGAQQESRLEKNFSKTLPGSKPKTTPTGRKSRAKKNWNPEYFITRGAMRKASRIGRTFTMPARRMEPTPHELTTQENADISKAIERGIQEAAKGTGL